MKRFRLVDRGIKPFEFTGEIIGHATTWRPGKARWTEILIYRTDGGNYVTESRGRSRLYHLPGRDCSAGTRVTLEDLLDEAEQTGDENLLPCEICKPPDIDGLYDTYDRAEKLSGWWFRREVDFAQIGDTGDPGKIPDLLMDRRYRKLAAVAIEAILKAGEKDPRIADIFKAEVIP